MTISQELIDRYTQEVDVDWWEALAISHPTFAGTFYIHNAPTESSLFGTLDGGTQTFISVPFEISLPERNSEGRSDVRIVIGAAGNALNEVLDGALTQPEFPIVVQYTAFLFTDQNPLYDPPLRFNMTEVTDTDTGITAVASPGDSINRPFPNGRYRVSSFPGLNRR